MAKPNVKIKKQPGRRPGCARTPGSGRKKHAFNLVAVEKAAAIGCTDGEIAYLSGISAENFCRRRKEPELAAAIERGRDRGRASLGDLQWAVAKQGNPTMLIWLGKQLLNQSDHPVSPGEKRAGLIFTVKPINADMDDGQGNATT